MKRLLIASLFFAGALSAEEARKPFTPPKAHTCNECKTDAKKAKAEKHKAKKDAKEKKKADEKARHAPLGA